MSMWDKTLLMGDFTRAGRSPHHMGVAEAVRELGGEAALCDYRVGNERGLHDMLDRGGRFSAVLMLGPDAMRDGRAIARLRETQRCPLVFWHVDVSVGLVGLHRDDWERGGCDAMFLTNWEEAGWFRDRLDVPVHYLPQGVRTRGAFPERSEGFEEMCVFAGQRLDNGHFCERNDGLKMVGERISVRMYPAHGGFDRTEEGFRQVEKLYRNADFKPCLNWSSRRKAGSTSNRFWVIVQEGGIMLTVDEEHYDFIPGEEIVRVKPFEIADAVRAINDMPVAFRRAMAHAAWERGQKRHTYRERLLEMERKI